ncbi:endonuclease domain-containing protein [Leifsonia sp. A12D58]|uniref:endonuclease domain-containing protein n=1 Tax=Leifsonia sp. A12D58 TaxID=3397674 RepID=UPI0039E04E9C
MQRSLTRDIVRFDGIATRSQLRRLGYSQRAILKAIEIRELWPVGRSWLVHSSAQRQPIRAVAIGGRLAAASALVSYGVWVTYTSGLWVASPQTASRLPLMQLDEHRLWWHERFPVTDDKLWRMSLRDSLAQFARIGAAEDVIASCDSALNSGLLTREELAEVFNRLPRRIRQLLALVDGKAESGLETLLRLAALAQGWTVDIQVRIVGVGRVDLVIDGWLVIEADGAKWHDDDVSRDEDSRREAELILRGYRWHRFRYRQVLEQMPLCMEVIRTILASGRPAQPAESQFATVRL